MKNITIFKNEIFGEIRVTVKESGEPMFCLLDVAGALEIKNTSDLKARLNQNGVGIAEVIDSMGRTQQATFINESNLYKCVFRSRRPEAEKFQDWICEDVLPSIRKHGAYMSDEVIQRTLTDPDYLIQLATVLKEEKQKRAEAETKVAILTHTNKTYTATEVAKEMGMRSAKELNKWLEQQHVQYKVNETWVPCAKYSDMAWFEIKQEELDNGHIIYHRKITGLGREGILDLYNSVNRTDILP